MTYTVHCTKTIDEKTDLEIYAVASKRHWIDLVKRLFNKVKLNIDYTMLMRLIHAVGEKEGGLDYTTSSWKEISIRHWSVAITTIDGKVFSIQLMKWDALITPPIEWEKK